MFFIFRKSNETQKRFNKNVETMERKINGLIGVDAIEYEAKKKRSFDPNNGRLIKSQVVSINTSKRKPNVRDNFHENMVRMFS